MQISLLKKAQAKRQEYSKKNTKLSSVELDYLFLQDLHALIDADLIEIGEKFYLPTLRDQWKNQISASILQGQI